MGAVGPYFGVLAYRCKLLRRHFGIKGCPRSNRMQRPVVVVALGVFLGRVWGRFRKGAFSGGKNGVFLKGASVGVVL